MIRMAVKDGSPGNNSMRFVFQDACDETSSIASQRRTFEEASKGRFHQGAAASGQSREMEGQTRKGLRSGRRDWFFSLDRFLFFQAKARTFGETFPMIRGRSVKQAMRKPWRLRTLPARI